MKPVEVPGTRNLLWDGERLIRRNGRPAGVRPDRPREYIRFVDGCGRERCASVQRLVESVTTGVPCIVPGKSGRDASVSAARKYELAKVSDARLRERLLADAEDERHGTIRGYQLGCRCHRCRNAMRLGYRLSKTKDEIRACGRNPYTGGDL